MIRKITLKFGPAADRAPAEFEVSAVTVFVGPNNAGKSKVLQEINRRCTSGVPHPSDVILESLTFAEFPIENIADTTNHCTLTPQPHESVKPGNIIVGHNHRRLLVPRDAFGDALRHPNTHSESYCTWYLAFRTLMLDGKSRITLVNEQVVTDLQQAPSNSLDVLFRDDEKRAEVRRITHDAFGNYFVVDPTSLGKLRVRYSAIAPTDHQQERGIHAEAVNFHGQALGIDQASDGVKAFTGIITQIIAGDPSVILIDEPEAFLHPALSFKLGREVAVSAVSSDKRLFVSTHSANFVMGCIQSGAATNIVRLTYQHGVPTARTLPNDKLLRLMRNPLLRSTGVLEGLFYESVIVAEADSDRAFYREINERLLRTSPIRGIPNCLFLTAQNKQTIHQIVQPLRELGIPAAGIVDIDIVKDGGKNWTDFLNGGYVPNVSHCGLGQIRSAIQLKFEESGKNMKKDGGIAILKDPDKEAAQNLFAQLSDYGLFVVPGGELESWLGPLGATGHGPAWLVEVFERMGEDPDDKDYVVPETGDVWAFIERVGAWLRSPNRKGIPT